MPIIAAAPAPTALVDIDGDLFTCPTTGATFRLNPFPDRWLDHAAGCGACAELAYEHPEG